MLLRLKAPRRLPLAAALLLLVLWAALAAASSPRLIWRDQRLRPSDPQVSRRVAYTALSYFNHQTGSPSRLRVLSHVKKLTFKIIPGLGRKYFLQFGTKDSQTKQNLGMCYATVFYMKEKPKPDVNIACSKTSDTAERLQEDYNLYSRISGDSHPSQDQLRAVAILGSNCIVWETSTEDSLYFLKEIKDVKRQIRYDDSLELYFTVVLDNDALESPTSCQARMVWQPGTPASMKYDCSSEDESSGSADGSGVDLDYASGFFIDSENNF